MDSPLKKEKKKKKSKDIENLGEIQVKIYTYRFMNEHDLYIFLKIS